MGRPPEPQLTNKRRLLPCWDIYLASSAPATLLGTIEAPNADAAIEAAVREFHVNDEHGTRLIAILKSAGIRRPRESLWLSIGDVVIAIAAEKQAPVTRWALRLQVCDPQVELQAAASIATEAGKTNQSTSAC
jgi:hypothetical protein